MGFRSRHFNPIYRTYISQISSHTHKTNLAPRALLYPSIPQFQDPSTFSSNPHLNVPRRWHVGHSHDHHHHLAGKEAEGIFRLGLAADIGLAAGKALTGYLSGSTAIIADAVHSVSDVVLSGIALWSFKAGNAPKDNEHPYGHGKFETLGALGISCMLLGTAGGIAWHASEILLGLFSAGPDVINHSLLHGQVHDQHHGGHHHGIDMNHPILALNMTIISIAVKEGLYWITKRAGEKQGSGLMKANAWHHHADAVSSLVALVGVGGSILGVKFLDPLAGLVVSGMILKAGIETGYQSVLELVDAAVPTQLLDPIRKTIVEVEGVKGCHRLRGRRAGSSLYLDVHIEVDPLSSVSAAHDVGESVRHEIHNSHPEVSEVFIHIDPSVPQQDSYTDKSHLTNSCTLEQDFEARNIKGHDKDVEAIVCEIFLSKFPEMFVERVTRHVIQGKMLLQIEVSMPPEIMIRDAMEMAESAEKEILRAASNVTQVSIQLCLGKAIQCGPR